MEVIICTQPKPAARWIAASRPRPGARWRIWGVEHIAAYSPQARGRSERLFHTLQDRVLKELALAGIVTMEAANAWLRDTYIPAHNARFAIKAEQTGSAFVAVPGLDLTEILCVQEDRVVGNDNCVSFVNRKLQIPESPLRPHFVKATVKVHQYPDGGLAVFQGPALSGSIRRQRRSDRRASRGGAREKQRRPLPPSGSRRARSNGRSAPGNGPDSLTRKCPTETPLLRRTEQERAAT